MMMARCLRIAILLSAQLSDAKPGSSFQHRQYPLAFAPSPPLRRATSTSSQCTFNASLLSRTHSFPGCERGGRIIANRLSLQENSSDVLTEETEAEDLKLPETIFTRFERPKDINTQSFGPLLPIAKAVDDATGGWGLSYADLHPATPRTSVGQAFLATNFCYAAGGLALGVQGEWFLGALTEIAGIVSFWYHYSQLEFGKNRAEVRLALLIDYFTAGSALITGGVYMIQAGIDSVPLDAILAAGGAVVCLTLCWVWEFGYPYIFWHSLWHILSAYTGYLIGREHITTIS
ncbi:hypothetical protein ACHAWX_007677 [Stephanocyclus meneghinianus]